MADWFSTSNGHPASLTVPTLRHAAWLVPSSAIPILVNERLASIDGEIREDLDGPTYERMHIVTSWRDLASQQAQDDLDDLLDASLPFAQEMLDKHGEFFPYALALTASGETNHVAGDPGEGEQPSSVAVLKTLVEGLRTERDTLRAAALVSDVRLSDSDAVRVELEHAEGHAIAVLLPYRQKRLRRGIEYGEISAGPGESQVWA